MKPAEKPMGTIEDAIRDLHVWATRQPASVLPTPGADLSSKNYSRWLFGLRQLWLTARKVVLVGVDRFKESVSEKVLVAIEDANRWLDGVAGRFLSEAMNQTTVWLTVQLSVECCPHKTAQLRPEALEKGRVFYELGGKDCLQPEFPLRRRVDLRIDQLRNHLARSRQYAAKIPVCELIGSPPGHVLGPDNSVGLLFDAFGLAFELSDSSREPFVSLRQIWRRLTPELIPIYQRALESQVQSPWCVAMVLDGLIGIADLQNFPSRPMSTGESKDLSERVEEKMSFQILQRWAREFRPLFEDWIESVGGRRDDALGLIEIRPADAFGNDEDNTAEWLRTATFIDVFMGQALRGEGVPARFVEGAALFSRFLVERLVGLVLPDEKSVETVKSVAIPTIHIIERATKKKTYAVNIEGQKRPLDVSTDDVRLLIRLSADGKAGRTLARTVRNVVKLLRLESLKPCPIKGFKSSNPNYFSSVVCPALMGRVTTTPVVASRFKSYSSSN